jgi:hypothetical protein
MGQYPEGDVAGGIKKTKRQRFSGMGDGEDDIPRFRLPFQGVQRSGKNPGMSFPQGYFASRFKKDFGVWMVHGMVSLCSGYPGTAPGHPA